MMKNIYIIQDLWEQIFIFLKNNKIKKKIRCLLENIYKIKAFTISVRCKKKYIYIIVELNFNYESLWLVVLWKTVNIKNIIVLLLLILW